MLIRLAERGKVGRERRDTRGDTRNRTRAKRVTKARTGKKENTREEYKGKDKNKGEYKGKGYHQGNPQNPFVASAQANQAAAAAAATPAQEGPPYQFRGWGPALQAAAPAAAAAAEAAPAQAAAAAHPGDVRERDAQKGVGKGQKGQIPVTPQKRVRRMD